MPQALQAHATGHQHRPHRPDLLDTFPDSESVNEALRSLKKNATRSAKPVQRQRKTASAAP
jgi:hypothetical protein